MSVSTKLCRVSNAENIEEFADIAKLIKDAPTVHLDRAATTLSMVFLNTADPYPYLNLQSHIIYKVVDGNYISPDDETPEAEQAWCDKYEHTGIFGFLPTSEIPSINQWMIDNNLENEEGFKQFCDILSEEVKQELHEMGTSDPYDDLYGYVEGLVQFYKAAEKERNAILAVSCF
jgi:hypothetical protein